MNAPKIHDQIFGQTSILFVLAAKNYSIFHLKNDRKLVSGYTLKFHEELLDSEQFLRLNRSMLVNKSYVKKIKDKNKASYVELQNGQNILISRRRLKIVKERYGITG